MRMRFEAKVRRTLLQGAYLEVSNAHFSLGFCGNNWRAIDIGKDYVTDGLGRKWLLQEGFGYNGNRAVPNSELSRAV